MKENLKSSSLGKKRIKKFLNKATVKKLVNIHFGCRELDDITIGGIVKEIKNEMDKDYFIDVDIQKLPDSETGRVEKLINFINEDLSKKHFKHWIHEGISIDNVFNQLNEHLDKLAFIILYPFRDKDREHEINILTSIRKFIEMKDYILLKIIIMSSRKVSDWDLSPYSPLKENEVEFFPIEIE